MHEARFENFSSLQLLRKYLHFLLVAAAIKRNQMFTGWKYNDPKWGGFERAKYRTRKQDPGLYLLKAEQLL